MVGSLTHCDGYRAAVARVGEMVSLGIDAEIHEPLPEGVAELRPSVTSLGRWGA